MGRNLLLKGNTQKRTNTKNSKNFKHLLEDYLISWVVSTNPIVCARVLGGVPFVGDFLRDPIPYLGQFRRKLYRRLQPARWTSATG